MPAKSNIVNLLGNDEWGRTPIGQTIAWAVTYGRYIMIGTEIIVLLAFVSRFSLDRKKTDLDEEITQKQAILQANAQLEKDIRAVHAQIATINALLPAQKATTTLLFYIQSMLPPDVYLQSLAVTKNKLTADAVAGTTLGFSQFLANMSAEKNLKDLAISEVRRTQLTGINFHLTATIASPTGVKK